MVLSDCPLPAMRRVAAVSAVLLLLASMLPAGASHASPTQTFLVTMKPGESAQEVAFTHRAQLVREHASTGLVEMRLAARDAVALQRDPRIALSEPDGLVRLAGASWDGGSWDGASWDSSRWDSSRWDASRWDASRPDSSRWDSSRWDASRWDSQGPGGDASLPWGLRAVRAPEAWATGAPAHARLVCLVDSGLDAAHPSLAANVLRARDGTPVGWDFVENDATPQDLGGHGTHLAGIIAATRDRATGVAGVGAPFVTMARVLDAQGVGRTADVISGISWCVGQQANVILLALTEDAPTSALAESIAAAQRQGALVVASAGNNGPCSDCVSRPAAYAGVMGVGAVAPDRTLAGFSSRGPEVDILAPGVHITSTYPGGIASASGTSQAAAFVAGAAAYMWSANPGWTAEQVARQLSRTAAPFDGGDGTPSPGILDLAAAMKTR